MNESTYIIHNWNSDWEQNNLDSYILDNYIDKYILSILPAFTTLDYNVFFDLFDSVFQSSDETN